MFGKKMPFSFCKLIQRPIYETDQRVCPPLRIVVQNVLCFARNPSRNTKVSLDTPSRNYEIFPRCINIYINDLCTCICYRQSVFLSQSVVWLEQVSQSVSNHRLTGSISQSTDRLEFSGQTADWLEWRHDVYHRLAEIFI